MGKVKIKKKSTFIDMTAMSDVTVLLLTFFMLTSTFLQKEPTIVYTPSSVSEEKVPSSNLVTILVSSADKSDKLDDPSEVEGKIFISFTGDVADSLSTENMRDMLLERAIEIHNEKRKNKIEITPAMRKGFRETNMFGLPFSQFEEFFKLDVTKRDKAMGDLTSKEFQKITGDDKASVGIPINNNKNKDGNLNDFQIWMQAVYDVAQDINNRQKKDPNLTDEQKANLENFYTALIKDGTGIAIKADKDTPYTVVQNIFDNLQTMQLNKFSLMTALTSEEEVSTSK